MYLSLIYNYNKRRKNMDKKNKEALEVALTNLLNKMENRKTVKKILQAKDVKGTYLEEKENVQNELNEFKIKMASFFEEGRLKVTPYDKLPEFINKDNVVDLCFALMMTEVFDDIDLLSDVRTLRNVLGKVSGELEEVANRFIIFLYQEGDGLFSLLKYDEILEKVVL
jgi:hypothetical protein